MTIKDTLKKEARYQASHVWTKMNEADQFCRKYFSVPNSKELLEALKKGPLAAESWIEKNY